MIATILGKFDKDHSGGIDYAEFIKGLFPNSALSYAGR